MINSNDVSAPLSVSKLCHSLEMTNQLEKFLHNIVTKSLRELLAQQAAWSWGPSQNSAFLKIKELSSHRILA